MMSGDGIKQIEVKTASGNYEVKIGKGLLKRIGEAVRDHTDARKCVVVSGEHVGIP